MQMNECTYNLDTKEGNPVHKHSDGTWWFYAETWADEHGPYTTQQICKQELKRYCDEVLG